MRIPASRLRICNQGVNPGNAVIYWMTSTRRTRWNHALQHSVNLALNLNSPLIVFEPLFISQKWACDRFHAFAIQGMLDNQMEFSDSNAAYVPFIEEEGKDAFKLLKSCLESASILVMDDSPVYYQRGVLEVASANKTCEVHAVDSNGFVSLRGHEKSEEFASGFQIAQALRIHLQKNVETYCAQFPEEAPLSRTRKIAPPNEAMIRALFTAAGVRNSSQSYLDAMGSSYSEGCAKLSLLDIDHRVAPVAHFPGGSREASRRWETFFSNALECYNKGRSHPEEKGVSTLSPYLHFGHISVHRILSDIFYKYGWSLGKIKPPHNGRRRGWWQLPEGVESFIDQVVVWRDLGHVHCALVYDHDKYESLPEWSQRTMEKHEMDRKKYTYSIEEFEESKTHDSLWNAAQTQLRVDGYIHNSLRMLWGKKILEWSANPRAAMETMVTLNDKWALDGRDPNSYSGIGWVMGKFDREFAERDIYGTVRYMASEQSKKKYETKKYLTVYNRRNNDRKTLLGDDMPEQSYSKQNVFASTKSMPKGKKSCRIQTNYL